MKSTRIEFSEGVKRLLAERVAFMCSNPSCRRLTIKPHSIEQKSIRFGEAGHIFGASNRGPRGDQSKSKEFLRYGIWLCSSCHSLVDKEKSAYESEQLIRWKNETENYTENLIFQDTRLRQLRLICQSYLSALRILSGLPHSLDETFNNPNGNGINLTRLFIELEMILFDCGFPNEAGCALKIRRDLDELVCPFVDNRKGQTVDIFDWKKIAVKLLMLDVLHFSNESYEKYLETDIKMYQHALNLTKGIMPEKIILEISNILNPNL